MTFKTLFTDAYPSPYALPRLNLTALPATAYADGLDHIVLRAELIDLITGNFIPDSTINFTLDQNAFFYGTAQENSKDALTDQYGLAYTEVVNYVPEVVTARASYAGSSTTPVVFITFLPTPVLPPTPEYPEWEIVIDKPFQRVPPNGMQWSTSLGRVLHYGQPAENMLLNSFVTINGHSVYRWIGRTDSSGVFQSRFTSVYLGLHTIDTYVYSDTAYPPVASNQQTVQLP